WMDLASNLTPLIQTHQLRHLVKEMPVLSPHHLKGHRKLRLAHLGLCLAGGAIPAGPGKKTLQLSLPPILTYADSVLAKWRLNDLQGENSNTLFSFTGGESCRGFFLVASYDCATLLVTELFSQVILLPMFVSGDVMAVCFIDLTATGVAELDESTNLKGWLLYEGVGDEPMMLSGGSAAQSSTLQCFDALLGICHDDHSSEFSVIFQFGILPTVTLSFDCCWSALVDLQSYHLSNMARNIQLKSEVYMHLSQMHLNLPLPFSYKHNDGQYGQTVIFLFHQTRGHFSKKVLSLSPSAVANRSLAFLWWFWSSGFFLAEQPFRLCRYRTRFTVDINTFVPVSSSIFTRSFAVDL
uniref:Uncharacterized protein n=1 Tax=Oncorhynchus kisutch TaxID=8019 RepID=A0A8C7K0C8_ONCKI